ncbi:MAG TPA: ATP-binding domain-containing protein [Actinophytocola sp.]|uniref:ATP-binding domain-containing protein n=1 Tax=Actinophytocola sp. TaxID=1872138 RepID=UPI002DDD3E51|nr:ATP-binding domain-containing protein [Actinophytocola sp.]HEV2782105.1 ATP-binding domain-containing protein [Actinophytocola sp.]
MSFLYERLDAERGVLRAELDRALRDSSATDPEARWQRDVRVRTLSTQVNRLRVAESGLCFGRIDGRDGGRAYIGRIGLFDAENDYEPLLVDWRAPASRPFYCATGARPEGLVRRRHFRTSGRRIIDFHDDLLDVAAADGADTSLLAALAAPRDGTMRDIVATIQAEQDEIIRLAHAGVVVIDGGPGTGKTAVALHRVAYLLYHQRDRLSHAGVLIVGPNAGFLRYIGDVLPSLGETDVVFATPGELWPGLSVTAEESPEIKRLKGSVAMVDVLAAAVADRQELPMDPISIELDDVTVSIDWFLAAKARDEARATGLRHNQARAVFADAVVEALTRQAVDRIDPEQYDILDPEIQAQLAADPLADGDADLYDILGPDIRAELAKHPQLAAAVERLWPALTPERLLADLFSSPARLAVAMAGSALYRPAGDAWTVSDVALLDEAAELLGPVQRAERAPEQDPVEYAEGVLEILDTDEDPDSELLRAVDVLTAERLAERHVELDHRTLAERAAADRKWAYGHIVVDEAQELSEMDWRVLMRRCPSRSITIVGDLAQRESPAGARSWGAMLEPFVADRWAHRRLTINYRTPAEIMEVAARVLPGVQAPESVRWTGERPWFRRVAQVELAGAVRRAVEAAGDGTVAVIAPEKVRLDVPATVLTPRAAKGLEFDEVIVVEPGLVESPADLYVALTRATRRLGVLHTTELPRHLCGLTGAEAGPEVRRGVGVCRPPADNGE